MINSELGIRFAGEVVVEKVQISSPSGGIVDIAPAIVELSLYEDMFSNSVYGTVLISDSFDLIHNMPLIGEELIDIVLATPSFDESRKIRYQGYVYKISDRIAIAERGQTYLIHFTSLETIIDINKKISKAFSGNIDQNVKELFKSPNMLGSSKILVIEETSNKLQFVSPFWSPMKVINWMAARALNGEGIPDYLFFERLDGTYNFVSLNHLYKQSPIDSVQYKYNNYTRSTNDLGSYKDLNLEYGIIREYYVDEVFDYIKRAKSGMYGNRVIAANTISKTIKTTSTDYLEDFQKSSHLSPYPVASDTMVRRKNAALHHYVNQEFVFDGQRNNRFAEWLLQRESLLSQARNVFKIDIVVPGRTDMHVGNVIDIELNQNQTIKSGDDKSQMVNSYFRDKFLVTSICHKISQNRHTMIMECCKDSLNKQLQ